MFPASRSETLIHTKKERHKLADLKTVRTSKYH